MTLCDINMIKGNNSHYTLHFYDTFTTVQIFFPSIFVSRLLNSNIDTVNTINPVSVGVRMCVCQNRRQATITQFPWIHGNVFVEMFE